MYRSEKAFESDIYWLQNHQRTWKIKLHEDSSSILGVVREFQKELLEPQMFQINENGPGDETKDLYTRKQIRLKGSS